MSVGWDFKWCPVSRITTALARKRPFHWISKKSRLVRVAMERSLFTIGNRHRRYMAEILPIRRKTLNIQSTNQSIYFEINVVLWSTIQIYLANHAPRRVETLGPNALYSIPPRNMDMPCPMAAMELIHVLSA